jgi:hypothetical protein
MTIKNHLFIIIFAASFATGCSKNKLGNSGSESGLSTVDIATPTRQDLEKAYGANCVNVKLNQETLAKANGKTGCDALIALTNDYRLTIVGGDCADGSKGTDVPATTGKLDSQNIQTSLKSKCDYSVKLELGLANVYYFDNAKTWRDNLKRSDVSGPTAQLALRLAPTGAGEQAGIPPGSDVQTTGFTQLKIQVNFGSPVTNGSDSNKTKPVEFVAPEGWNGLSFQGDSLFNLGE